MYRKQYIDGDEGCWYTRDEKEKVFHKQHEAPTEMRPLRGFLASFLGIHANTQASYSETGVSHLQR